MKCNEVLSRISDYIDNQLESSDRFDFEQHIAACKECSRELDTFKLIVNELNSIKEEDPPEEFTQLLHLKLKGIAEAKERRFLDSVFGRYIKIAVPAVAALLVVFLARGAILKNSFDYSKKSDEMVGNKSLVNTEANIGTYAETDTDTILIEKSNEPEMRIQALDSTEESILNSALDEQEDIKETKAIYFNINAQDSGELSQKLLDTALKNGATEIDDEADLSCGNIQQSAKCVSIRIENDKYEELVGSLEEVCKPYSLDIQSMENTDMNPSLQVLYEDLENTLLLLQEEEALENPNTERIESLKEKKDLLILEIARLEEEISVTVLYITVSIP